MTSWYPEVEERGGPLYRAIAASLAEDIETELLQPGTRLPTMRALAETLGVTVGTVYRAYSLAEKQGLVSRETGRGTFVRALAGSGAAREAEVAAGTADLSRNEPPEIPIGATLKRTLVEVARDCDLDGMLSYGHSQGQPRHRAVLAQWMKARGHEVDAESMIVTGGAQQGLTVALGGLSRPGDALLVEELTYPGIKSLARLFGLRLVPVKLDRDGLVPAALTEAAGTPGARLLYCMPNVQNPTTSSLSPERRQEIAEIARDRGLVVIEDDVNPRGAGTSLPPLARFYPEGTVYITSLSKTVAPGLRVGAVSAGAALLPDLVAASQTTSWMAPPLMAEVACRWVEDGTAAELMLQREAVTRRLHDLAAEVLAGVPYWSEPHNTHIWLPLVPPWSGEGVTARAAEQGIIVSPAERFAIDPASAPAGVRLCLANLPEPALRGALRALAGLFAARPGPLEFQM